MHYKEKNGDDMTIENKKGKCKYGKKVYDKECYDCKDMDECLDSYDDKEHQKA